MLDGAIVGYVVWVLAGCMFIGIGIHSFRAEKEVGFWANAKVLPMKDVKKYNRAVGKLWLVYGIVFMILGTPLLGGQNSAGILFSILGIMAETIAVMAVYVLVIQKKYEKK